MLIFKNAVANDVGPIREEVEIAFDPCVNVFIGPNSNGKSTIIRSLLAIQADWNYHGPDYPDYEDEPLAFLDANLDLPEGEGEGSFTVEPGPLRDYTVRDYFEHGDSDVRFGEARTFRRVYIPASRIPYPLSENALLEQASRLADIDHLRASNVVLDGRSIGVDINNLATNIKRSLNQFPYDDPFEDGAGAGWDSRSEWLEYCVGERIASIAEAVYACASKICPEVLTENEPGAARFVDSRAQGLTFSQDYGSYSTKDNVERQIAFGDLSSGTQGPLLMLWHIALTLHEYALEAARAKIAGFAYRLHLNQDIVTFDQLAIGELPNDYYLEDFPVLTRDEAYPNEKPHDEGNPAVCRVPWRDAWRQLPFVLLIDEIENHLHPTWQRRIIPALREFFPNAQIFATTHSPFVVAGLKAGQVHKLYRDKTGVVRAGTNSEDISGWTVEEILREYMEVLDPTDEETAISAAVLRWMRYQQPVVQDAEEWRQAKIAELRAVKESGRLHGDQAAAFDWLTSHVVLRGDAEQWWRDRIGELEDKVSPDLESHGPIAAQNQLFLQQLEELLERYEQQDEDE